MYFTSSNALAVFLFVLHSLTGLLASHFQETNQSFDEVGDAKPNAIDAALDDRSLEDAHKNKNSMHVLKFQVLHRCNPVLCSSLDARIHLFFDSYEQICYSEKEKSADSITHHCVVNQLPSRVKVYWPKYKRSLVINDVKESKVIRALMPGSPTQKDSLVSFDSQEPSSDFTHRTVLITNSNQGITCPTGRLRFPVGSTQSFSKRFFDGRLNNKRNLFQGARGENLRRLTGNAYVDNISIPAGACTSRQRNANRCPFPRENGGTGSNRPNARVISNYLLAQSRPRPSRRGLSDLVTYFGQFLDHDTDLVDELPRNEALVNPNDLELPIPVPKGDVIFDPNSRGNKVIPVRRFTFDKCTGNSTCRCPRQHINTISSIIDANTVYGSSLERSRLLRTLKDGLLKSDGKNLPLNTFGLENVDALNRDPTTLRVAGDVRSNESPTLLSLHTLFMREHNRLAREYKLRKPTATDEQIFQYARKILIAEIQAITFREYLPSLLGGTARIPAYSGYNPRIDTTIATEFSNAAFRVGHTQISSTVFRYESNNVPSPFGNLLLREGFFRPERVTNEGGVDPIIRGAVRHCSQEIDAKIVDELRNFLFLKDGASLDLASINIQRGRETGIPDFNTVRQRLGLTKFTTFEEITRNQRVATKLKFLYKDVNKVDLWVGGIAEDHERRSALGQTLRKIILDQFLRIRDGDRFWYEKILTSREIEYVHRHTLSRIIRLNTSFRDAPGNVFFATNLCKDVQNFQCVRYK